MKPNDSETNADSLEYQEEWLTAYLDGELSSEQRHIVEQRLASDPHAQRTLSELNVIRGLVQQLPDWSGPTVAMMPRVDTLPDAMSELSDALERDQPEHFQPETGHSNRPRDFRINLGRSRRERSPTLWLVDWWRPLTIAAGLLMIVGVGYGLWSGIDSKSSELAMESSPTGEAAASDRSDEETASAFGTDMIDEPSAMKAQELAVSPEPMPPEPMAMDRQDDTRQAKDMMQAKVLGDPSDQNQGFGRSGGVDPQENSLPNDPQRHLLEDSAIDAAIAGMPLGRQEEAPRSPLPDNPPMQTFSFPAPGADAMAEVEAQRSESLPPSAPLRGTDNSDQESFDENESAVGSLQNNMQNNVQINPGTRQLFVGSDSSWTNEMIQLELLNNSMLTPLRADERGANFYAQLTQATTNRAPSTPVPLSNAMVVAQLPEASDGRELFNQLVDDFQLQRMTEIETLATASASSRQKAARGGVREKTELEEAFSPRQQQETGDKNLKADGVVAPSVDELPAPNSALGAALGKSRAPATNTAPRQMLLLFLKRNQAEQIISQSNVTSRNSRSPEYLWITPSANRDSPSTDEERVILLLNSKM